SSHRGGNRRRCCRRCRRRCHFVSALDAEPLVAFQLRATLAAECHKNFLLLPVFESRDFVIIPQGLKPSDSLLSSARLKSRPFTKLPAIGFSRRLYYRALSRNGL